MAKKAIRPIRIEDNVAYVTLTRGRESAVDVADIHIVEGFNWCILDAKRALYAVRYERVGTKKVAILLHRQILGGEKNMIVDHIDGDGLNNRRSNLRSATVMQNSHNQKLSRANRSGQKGVAWNGRAQKWQARIMRDGRAFFLGLFATIEEATEAYARASSNMHGEFGRIG